MRQNWFEAKGDETLALDWPLDETAHVWEIGGFEGRWAAQMAEKFHCFIDIFEPQKWAVERMTKRFADNPKVSIHPYGLWTMPGYFRLSKGGTDGATLMGGGADEPLWCWFENFRVEIEKFPWEIDLALMNVEGAEYWLIPGMLRTGTMQKVKRFWCQFHKEFELKDGQSQEIMESMLTTHDLLWDCFPTAVAWKRKETV